MENCCDDVPVWNRYADPTSYGYKYIVKATFEEKKLTEFYLRFGKPLKQLTKPKKGSILVV